jgi:hypothetical protein
VGLLWADREDRVTRTTNPLRAARNLLTVRPRHVPRLGIFGGLMEKINVQPAQSGELLAPGPGIDLGH